MRARVGFVCAAAALLSACGDPNEDRLSRYVGAWMPEPVEAERVRQENVARVRRSQEERAAAVGAATAPRRLNRRILEKLRAELAQSERDLAATNATRDPHDVEDLVLLADGTARLGGSPKAAACRWWIVGDSIHVEGEYRDPRHPTRVALDLARRGETLHVDRFQIDPPFEPPSIEPPRVLIRDEREAKSGAR
jgi:hypothetical protein